MTIVQPPCVLDFGKVYFDQPPEYKFVAQCVNNTFEEMRENFGENVKKVLQIISYLETNLGIYYVDPKPKNIDFGDDVE